MHTTKLVYVIFLHTYHSFYDLWTIQGFFVLGLCKIYCLKKTIPLKSKSNSQSKINCLETRFLFKYTSTWYIISKKNVFWHKKFL
jgi:hypothetical protein